MNDNEMNQMKVKIVSLITSITVFSVMVIIPNINVFAYSQEDEINNRVVINFSDCAEIVESKAGSENEYVFQLLDNVEVEGIDKLSSVDELCKEAKIYRTDNLNLIEQLESFNVIEQYEEDGKIYLDGLSDEIASLNSQDYRSAMLGYNYISEKSITGNGVKVAVIDSGLSDSFPDFSSATILTGENCLVEKENENRNNVEDTYGHGTFVTSVICGNETGMASEVTILPLKCFEGNESSYSYVIEAINIAIEQDCDVINLSLGSTTAFPLLEETVQSALDKGIIIVASAGNIVSGGGSTGSDDKQYPASHDGVISVGAVNSSKAIWKKSVQNSSVCVVAPGVNVSGFSLEPSQLTKNSGTSFAAPVVSATAALALSEDRLMTSEVFKDLLISTSEDLGELGKDNSYGYGLINPALLLASVTKDTDSIILTGYEGKIGISSYFDYPEELNFICFYNDNGRLLYVSERSRLCNFQIPEATNRIGLFSVGSITFEPIKEVRKE